MRVSRATTTGCWGVLGNWPGRPVKLGVAAGDEFADGFLQRRLVGDHLLGDVHRLHLCELLFQGGGELRFLVGVALGQRQGGLVGLDLGAVIALRVRQLAAEGGLIFCQSEFGEAQAAVPGLGDLVVQEVDAADGADGAVQADLLDVALLEGVQDVLGLVRVVPGQVDERTG